MIWKRILCSYYVSSVRIENNIRIVSGEVAVDGGAELQDLIQPQLHIIKRHCRKLAKSAGEADDLQQEVTMGLWWASCGFRSNM